MRLIKNMADAIKGKTVIMRVDFNVPIDDDGNTTNDRRIRAAVPTIQFVLAQGCKLVLISHLGRPKGKAVEKLRLDNVADRLRGLLPDVRVKKVDDCVGDDVRAAVANAGAGEIVLLENLRFHEEEEDNDPGFAKELASLADFYVNDAFGTAHRAHASTEGIAHLLPSAAGFIIEKEVDYLQRALAKPEHPYVAILGGAKVDTKIGVITNLLPKVDKILIGGAMAYTFLKAKGVNIGDSLLQAKHLELAGRFLAEGGDKLVLPVDHVCASGPDDTDTVKVTDVEIPDGLKGFDIGPRTCRLYAEAIEKAKMIVWNGPLGMAEKEAFAAGTRQIADAVAGADAVTIVGGGETAEMVENYGLDDKIDHVSTGGGACLEFLEGKDLPGLEILK